MFNEFSLRRLNSALQRAFSRATAPVSALLVLGCAASAGAQDVKVSISPTYVVMQLGQQQPFTAKVTGSGNTAVTWQVDSANGGNLTVGTISTTGVYAAPAAMPNVASVTVTAVSQADPSKSATAVITLVTQPATGNTYYVSPSGKDSNPGTFNQPWRTIQHAADTVQAGDTVYVRQGVYKEVITLKSSGSAGTGFITFSSYPGELATLDGTGLPIKGGQWGLLTIPSQSYIVINGFEVRNYKTRKVADTPIGIWIFGQGSNLQIVNNHIHNIETNAPANSSCNTDAFGLTVDGTVAHQSINTLVISGNELDHMKTGCSETLSVDGNVENFVISNNLVHDDDNIGIDAIGFEKHVDPDPKTNQARDGEIRGNTIYNITSYGNPDYDHGKEYAADGVYVDGGTRIVIEQNLIHHVDLGIEIASEHHPHVASHVIARNNVIYLDNSNGISIGGYAGNVGGTDYCTIVNNTLFENGTKGANNNSGEFQIQFHATHNIYENNIAYANTQALFLNNFTFQPLHPAAIDYNLYYSKSGASNGNWTWEGKNYTGYNNYRKKTGLDADSPPFSDPQFISTANPPNLDVQPTSPAVNAGKNLGENVVGAVDFAGNPRVQNGLIDIGAYEPLP